jgi:hypothetical protein
MQRQKWFKLFVLTSFVLSFSMALYVPSASAGDLWNKVYKGGLQGVDKEFGENDDSDVKDIRQIVVDIIRALLSFLGLYFVILIILAGYKYMTSEGDSGKVEEAVHSLRNAVIGLVIILASLGILSFIDEKMLDLFFGPGLI